MSGVEVAGLVLAVLPLLVSTAEHYREILSPFETYRKFSKELRRFHAGLVTQEAIFHEEVKHLLALRLGRSRATQILLDSIDSAEWVDEVDQALASESQRSWRACQMTVEGIASRLERLTKARDGFSEILACSKKEKKKNSVGEKLKFSFTKMGLYKDLKELRRQNEDLRTLVLQISRSSSLVPDSASVAQARTSRAELSQLPIRRLTSSLLYESFSHACTKHNSHELFLDLAPTIQEKPQFRMQHAVAIRQSRIGDENEKPLSHVMVETVMDGELKPSSSTKIGMKRLGEKEDDSFHENQPLLPLKSSNGARKRVKELFTSKKTDLECIPMETVSGFAILPDDEASSRLSTSLAPELPNLSRNESFCTHLAASCRAKAPDNHAAAIGFLVAPQRCQKHLLYLQSKLDQHSRVSDLLQTLHGRETLHRLSQYERVAFARNLAAAILQFHGTPWLTSRGWSSQDIFIFWSATKQDSVPALTDPKFVNVMMYGTSSAAVREEPISSPIIRNPVLFRFAILLIELAFEAPLASLRRAKAAVVSDESEFAFATGICREVGKHMGKAYRDVVEKCLFSFPGVEPDLGATELQHRYQSEVVCELQRLEDGLKRLQLG